MRPEREVVIGFCPLCDRAYVEKNNRTRHHIFPVFWRKQGVYGKGIINITVCACEECHEGEFNRLYPMRLKEPWTKSECLIYWIKFCISKGKDPLKIYPQLSQCFT